MTFGEYRYLVRSDLYRLRGGTSARFLFRLLLLGGSAGAYQYVFWMRTCRYTSSRLALKLSFYPVARIMLRRYTYRYGIDIPVGTHIGPGFYVGHFGGIVINERTVIGRNCNVSHGVTIGQANRGTREGYAVIGDDTYFGPGAKVVGAVHIGSNVAVGANCVVTKDVPDDAVVVGVPGKVISRAGAAGYVEFTDYDRIISPDGSPRADS